MIGLQSIQFSSFQALTRVLLFATLWTAARQASLSITNAQNLLKLMSIESVMPSNHLILCPTPEKIVERISQKYKIEKVEIAKALCQMLDDGYIYKAVAKDEKNKKISILKPNWDLLARDKLWQH